MNLNGNPLRLIRNIRRIIDVKKASQRSIKSKSKRTYLLPGLKNTILVIIGIALADTFRHKKIILQFASACGIFSIDLGR